MKEKLFLAVGLVFILSSIYLFLQKPAPAHYQKESWTTDQITFPGDTLIIGEALISIELADSSEEITRGLSGRSSLEKGSGLLFIFEVPGKYGFWMKEMKFPIDIVWISKDWEVVSVTKDVSPETYPAIFYPPYDVKYVLELSAGSVDELGIDIGEKASLK